ncbi:GPI inositol deacylase [Lobulomyces angularis]|nr:GPI inositol deacylase [Lobulomyces angularis]
MNTIFSVICVCLFFISIDSNINYSLDPKRCEMSYMYPGYALMNLTFSAKYKLYYYRDLNPNSPQKITDSPVGIPVLFLPGSSGSYGQIRSIAAATTQEYWKLKSNESLSPEVKISSFDFFTIHSNEEFSAFHSQGIEDQAIYANAVIKYILGSYKSSGFAKPRSVIVIAHSMGGIVVRQMMTLPEYIPGSVSTIFTFATPHLSPPLSINLGIDLLYNRLRYFFSNGISVKNLVFVSIASGNHDFLVQSDKSDIESIIPEEIGFTVYSNNIPEVWSAADHKSILWCKQLCVVLSKALYDLVDAKNPQQLLEQSARLQKLKQRFLGPTDNNNFNAELKLKDFSSKKISLYKDENVVYKAISLNVSIFEVQPKNSLIIFTNIDSSALTIKLCIKQEFVVESLQLQCIDSHLNYFKIIPHFSPIPLEKVSQEHERDLKAKNLYYNFNKHIVGMDGESLKFYYVLSVNEVLKNKDVFLIGRIVEKSFGGEFDIFFGLNAVVKQTNPVTAFKLRLLQTDLFKYNLYLFSGCEEESFMVRQSHSDSKEEKFFLIRNSEDLLHINFFLDEKKKENLTSVLTIEIFNSKLCSKDFKIKFSIDWRGSFGQLLRNYLPAFATLPFGYLSSSDFFI